LLQVHKARGECLDERALRNALIDHGALSLDLLHQG